MKQLIFKSIIRLFCKNKLIFSLCVLGLSVGFAVFITIIMHTRFEYSYDRDQPGVKNIYRMHPIYGQEDGFISMYATSDNGYGPSLKKDIPEVLDYVRMIAYQSNRIITYSPVDKQKTQYRESHVFVVDPNFFSFFGYKLKIGSPGQVLVKPGTMVISEGAARKYFGNENPIGKQLVVSDYGNPYQCEITGVFYDVPVNSNLQFDFLVSFESLKQRFPQVDNSWNFGISYTYLRLAEKADVKKLEKQVMEVFKARSGFVIPGNLKYEMVLEPMLDIHLNDPIQWELEKKGNRAETKYLLIIALLIITVSWLNYMNITTSLVNQRSKISRIKIILGSGRTQLIMQFIAEAFLVNLVSLLISILFIILGQSVISSFLGCNALMFIFNNHFIVILLFAILFFGTLTTGLLAAIIFFVSNPDFLLGQKKGNSKSSFRQVMVVAQFTAGIALIIGTLVIYKQVRFLKSQELGIDLAQMVVIKAPAGADAHTAGINRFRQLLANKSGIEDVSAGSDIPGQFMDMGYMVNRTSIDPPIHQITDGGRIDHKYVETLGLEILAGEDFSEGMNTERRVLINEEMVHLLKFENNEDAVGKQIILPEIYGTQPVTVLGVLKNYRQQSPSYHYKPMFFQCRENDWLKFNYFIVRYNGDTSNILAEINNKWKEAFPQSSFDYYFLTDQYNSQYGGDIRFGQLFGILSVMAILISMLGLLGLSINTAQQRIKEIGIRKINGAKVLQVMIMLNRDFVRWVALAILIASPIAWYAMNLWLNNYATRTSIDWWIFALAALLALGIAVLTVSWQSWKAAIRNPVEALRYE